MFKVKKEKTNLLLLAAICFRPPLPAAEEYWGEKKHTLKVAQSTITSSPSF